MSEERPTQPSSPEAPGAGSIAARLLVAAALAAGLAFVLSGDFGPPPVTRGATAPDFDLPRIGDGGPLRLADYAGRPVLVNFWATWCKPCEEEIPAMERLYRDLHPQGFELIAVSVDQVAEDVVAFQERFGMTFPVAHDPDQSVSRAYQTTGYPESVLVDGEGRVVERYVGPREWDRASYVDRIRRLLEESAG